MPRIERFEVTIEEPDGRRDHREVIGTKKLQTLAEEYKDLSVFTVRTQRGTTHKMTNAGGFLRIID